MLQSPYFSTNDLCFFGVSFANIRVFFLRVSREKQSSCTQAAVQQHRRGCQIPAPPCSVQGELCHSQTSLEGSATQNCWVSSPWASLRSCPTANPRAGSLMVLLNPSGSSTVRVQGDVFKHFYVLSAQGDLQTNFKIHLQAAFTEKLSSLTWAYRIVTTGWSQSLRASAAAAPRPTDKSHRLPLSF